VSGLSSVTRLSSVSGVSSVIYIYTNREREREREKEREVYQGRQ
jgi:hypothetical protein